MKFQHKILSILLAIGFLLGGGLFWLSGQYTVPVMMYHNVSETANFQADTVSPKNFEWQIAYLKKHYQIITLAELVDGIKTGKKFPRNSVAITFDDGNRNNYTAAFPILQKYQVPAHFFICVGHIEKSGILTWSDVLTMSQAGMAFGSHGMLHAYLPDAAPQEQNFEIFQSKKILEQKLQKPIRFYAYPIGGFSEDIKNLMKKAEYEAAFTTNRGIDPLDHDVYEINRIRFGDRDINDWTMRAKLSGYYYLFRKLKNSH